MSFLQSLHPPWVFCNSVHHVFSAMLSSLFSFLQSLTSLQPSAVLEVHQIPLRLCPGCPQPNVHTVQTFGVWGHEVHYLSISSSAMHVVQVHVICASETTVTEMSGIVNIQLNPVKRETTNKICRGWCLMSTFSQRHQNINLLNSVGNEITSIHHWGK